MVIAVELCQKSVISHKPYTRMVVWDCNKLVNKIIRLWYQCRRPRCLYQITIYRVINLDDILNLIFFQQYPGLNVVSHIICDILMSYIIVFELRQCTLEIYSKTFSLISYRMFRSWIFFFIFLPAFYQSCHLFLKWLYFYYFIFHFVSWILLLFSILHGKKAFIFPSTYWQDLDFSLHSFFSYALS